MRLLIIFIAVPLIEIGLFIQVGDKIGLWPTLLIVLITAITGTWLVRSQGAQTLVNLQGSFQNMKDPTEPLAHGALILFAGALLLPPGFFTDSVGFLLLRMKVGYLETNSLCRLKRLDGEIIIVTSFYGNSFIRLQRIKRGRNCELYAIQPNQIR